MHHSRASRSVAVLTTTLLAFQFWLAGSGMACIMPRAAMQPATTRAAAMSMSMPVERGATAANRPAMNAHPTDMPRQMPCDQQTNLPMCQAMGPCVTALVAALSVMNAGPHRTPSLAIAMVVLTPPSRTFPPELPPPRA